MKVLHWKWERSILLTFLFSIHKEVLASAKNKARTKKWEISWEFGINIYILLLLLLLLLLSHFSHVQLCATPEITAHQAPPSPGFSRQEHWSGLPFPSPHLHTTIYKLDNQQNLLHSTDNCTQYFVIIYKRKESEMKFIYALLSCTSESITMLQIQKERKK